MRAREDVRQTALSECCMLIAFIQLMASDRPAHRIYSIARVSHVSRSTFDRSVSYHVNAYSRREQTGVGPEKLGWRCAR